MLIRNNKIKQAIIQYINLNIKSFMINRISKNNFFIIDLQESIEDFKENINRVDIVNYIINILNENKILFQITEDVINKEIYIKIQDKELNVIKALSVECKKK